MLKPSILWRTPLVVVVTLLLSMCARDVEVVQAITISYPDTDPIELNVRQIVFQDERKRPPREDISAEFPTDFSKVIEQWSREALRATGKEGLLTVRILEFQVLEQTMDTNKAFLDRVKDEANRRLLSEAVIQIDAQHPTLRTRTFRGVVTLDRIDTLLESDGEFERLQLLNTIAKAFALSFDLRARKLIRTEGKDFVAS